VTDPVATTRMEAFLADDYFDTPVSRFGNTTIGFHQ